MSIGTIPSEAVQFGRGARSFILLILSQDRSYGYQIRQRLQDEFGYQRAADPGALYRLLREMEAAGLIESTWDVASTGPARRYYRLTAAGREELGRGADRLRRQAARIERFLELYERQAAPETDRPA